MSQTELKIAKIVDAVSGIVFRPDISITKG
jgi:hypothetical protein